MLIQSKPSPANRSAGRSGRPFRPSSPALALAWMGLVGVSAVQPARAAFTYPNCPDAAENQFRYQPVIGRAATVDVGGPIKTPLAVDGGMLEPLHMAFDLQEDGKTDIYYVEKGGAVKHFDAATNKVATLGTVAGMSTGGEMGLSGIALDPDFKANRHMYLFYAQGSPAEFRLSRFTLTAGGQLDNAVQKVLLRFPRTGGNHTGGAMMFDSYGDLWITVGKNAPDYPNSYNETAEASSTEATSSNLASFRGGILRIHPDNSAKGYSIPAGNFGQHFAGYFRSKGNAAVAAQYENPALVLPELYVKGTRNAYSIAVHPTKRWMAWGEFGVNTRNTFTEEHNLVTRPAFGGYPYFAGGFGNLGGEGSRYYPLWSSAGAGQYNAAHPGLAQSIAGPVNKSQWNKGPEQLPPVTPAIHTYMHGAEAGAVTGPLYTYDPAVKSAIKWPPHFDGAWFITDWVQKEGNGFLGAKIFKLSPDGEKLIDSVQWFKDLAWNHAISFDQGPDGAIYIIMYHGWRNATPGTHIGRLEYTGTCHPTGSTYLANQVPSEAGFRVDLRTVSVTEPGPSRVSVRDSRGREVFAARHAGPGDYALGNRLTRHKGLYWVTVETRRGAKTVRLSSL